MLKSQKSLWNLLMRTLINQTLGENLNNNPMIPTLYQLNNLLEKKYKLNKVYDNTIGNNNTKIYTDCKRRIYILSIEDKVSVIYTEIYHNNYEIPIINDIVIQYVPIRETIQIEYINHNELSYQHGDNNEDKTIHTFNTNENQNIISYYDDRGNYWDEEMNMGKCFLSPEEHIKLTINRCMNNQFEFPIKETKPRDSTRILIQIKQDMISLANQKSL